MAKYPEIAIFSRTEATLQNKYGGTTNKIYLEEFYQIIGKMSNTNFTVDVRKNEYNQQRSFLIFFDEETYTEFMILR